MTIFMILFIMSSVKENYVEMTKQCIFLLNPQYFGAFSCCLTYHLLLMVLFSIIAVCSLFSPEGQSGFPFLLLDSCVLSCEHQNWSCP